MTILRANNLKKVYTTRFGAHHVQALANVSFSVEQVEYVAIMGESGAGKTTLLNILAALDKPTSGEVWLGDRKQTDIPEKELAAYRRAETVERQARNRAAQMYHRVNGLIAD